MPKAPKIETQYSLNPTSQMAFAVALCALAAAGVGTIVNHWLTGWMAVGGMVGVGLFYAGVGVLNLRSKNPAYEDDANLNVSQRTARVANLVGEPVTNSRSRISNQTDSRHLRVKSEDSAEAQGEELRRLPKDN